MTKDKKSPPTKPRRNTPRFSKNDKLNTPPLKQLTNTSMATPKSTNVKTKSTSQENSNSTLTSAEKIPITFHINKVI